jgi:hypothetical protein
MDTHNPTPASPSGNKGYPMIWGGLIAGIFFLVLFEVQTPASFSLTLYSTPPFVLFILSLLINAVGYYRLFHSTHKNLWWLLLLIPSTLLVMLLISIPFDIFFSLIPFLK